MNHKLVYVTKFKENGVHRFTVHHAKSTSQNSGIRKPLLTLQGKVNKHEMEVYQ